MSYRPWGISRRGMSLACGVTLAVTALVVPAVTGLRAQEPAASSSVGEVAPIRVTPGGTPLFPIAIPDLVYKGDARHANLGMTGALVLSHDLDYSFYFRILSPSRFIRTPTSSVVEADEFSAWSAIGADALIVGEYSVDAMNAVEVTLRLYDVTQRRLLVAKRYRGAPAQWRRMMHRFADEVLLAITGTRGPFYSRIAFASKRTGNKELYLADADGKNIRQITNNQSINLAPAFGPTGNTLVFTSYATGVPALTYLDLAKATPRTLYGSRGLTMAGAFSPDGTEIAFSHSPAGDSDLYILDVRRNALRRLTRSWGLDISPSYSPDGRRLAFVSDKSGQVPHIYVMPARGGRARRISGFEYSVSPSWSPTGNLIAYASRAEDQLDILVAEVDDRSNVIRTRRVTNTPESEEDPVFSPDGRYLLFTYRESLWVVPAREGYAPKRVISLPGGASSPAWSPRFGTATSPAAHPDPHGLGGQ